MSVLLPVHDSGAGQPSVVCVALADFLEDVRSCFKGIAGGSTVSVVAFLELVGDSSIVMLSVSGSL